MNILIIRPGAIGDALLTFPVLAALRAKHTHAHITFVSNPAVVPLAKAWGIAEEVGDYGDVRWSELFSPTGLRHPDLLNLLREVDQVICWLRDEDGTVRRNIQAVGVNQIIIAPGRPPGDDSLHVAEYLAETAGMQDMKIEELLSIWMTRMGQDSMSANNGSIAIHPGSGGAQKCWPATSFAAVVAALLRMGYPVLLLAGPAEAERVQDMSRALAFASTDEALATPAGSERNALGAARGAYEILENAPLLEIAERLHQCSGYLGNDAGITHLAALLGIPTLVLFGPSDPAIWRPIGPRVEVIREQPLESLPVKQVLDALLCLVM